MVVKTETCIGLRCPACGELLLRKITLFEFGRKGRVVFGCNCGSGKVIVARKRKGRLMIHVPCVLCDSEHHVYLSESDVWGVNLRPILCQETGIEIAFFGEEGEVLRVATATEEEAKRVLAEENCDYFDNPGVMYEILNHLHRVANDDGLVCPCREGEVEVEVYSDRVELHCTNCHRWWIVKAGKEEDLAILNWEGIQLADDGGQGMDAGKTKRRH